MAFEGKHLFAWAGFDMIGEMLYREHVAPSAAMILVGVVGRDFPGNPWRVRLASETGPFTFTAENWCGGWDLNPRTPAGQGPEPCAFDLAWQPPHGTRVRGTCLINASRFRMATGASVAWSFQDIRK